VTSNNRSDSLNAPVCELGGVGDKMEARLNNIGIYTVQDLLFHLPTRYLDRTRLTPIGSLQPGTEALAQGIVELTQVRFGQRRSLLCRISDGTGAITLRFFHFNKLQQNGLAKGTCIRCWGSPRRGSGSLEMIHPEYERIQDHERDHVEQTLTPVYPATAGLTQGRLRRLTDQALHALETRPEHLPELLPRMILAKHKLFDLSEALRYVHRPPPDADIPQLMNGTHPAQQRLSFEELLAHHLSLQSLRTKIRALQAPVLQAAESRTDSFLKKLPFTLTDAQQKTLSDIRTDMQAAVPMLRLVQGDVGSGKTIVAAIAALDAIDAGFQVAFMAPTELLADQHYVTLSQWFSDLDIPVLKLTGKLNRSKRTSILEQIATTNPLIILGTHALFQAEVGFGKLGFIIIDEQHRFGVHQRLALFEKGATRQNYPHQLIMTATPIPRTLTMTVFADLDISVIDELPPGRQPIQTVAMSNDRRPEIIDRIAAVCHQHRQVYWVCTLIEESDAVQYQAATDTHQYLTEMLPDLDIGLIHGRMKSADREKVMNGYKTGDINLLVATTVIEVGVDVPAASLMIIENAERLGLSQLHQLRGRIGRGTQHSVCVLMYHPPLSEIARERLEIMRNTNDGFLIAQKDLELRGPGEILGVRQTGLPDLRIADLMRDARLIPQIQELAGLLLDDYPEKIEPLISRWLSNKPDYGIV